MSIPKRLCSMLLICAIFLTCLPLEGLAASKVGYTTRIVYMFKKASTSGGRVMTIQKNAKVQLGEKSGNFYKATYAGKSGYIYAKYITFTAPKVIAKEPAQTKTTTAKTDPHMNGITKLSQIPVPETSKPGDSGTKVMNLQRALKLLGYYKPAIDGKYGSGTTDAVKAYQKAKKLAVDGVAGNGTIKAIWGKNAANYKEPEAKYKTETLDWFKDGKRIFGQAGITFKVKDVATGKVWTCRRLYSGNHLDAEPLTAKDTEIMKSAYGGAFNYHRRAVLVMYNGHVYAGSMYGEPHGDYQIKNNNFNGQFCIHFSGSKTSATKKVDSEHQNAIKKAQGASW